MGFIDDISIVNGIITLSLRFIGDTLWETNSLLWKMAIEIVGFPIENGDFLALC